MKKAFRLYFRFRTVTNDLSELYETCETTSIKNARAIGKRLAAERGQQYAGKYWFVGIEGKGVRIMAEAVASQNVFPAGRWSTINH